MIAGRSRTASGISIFEMMLILALARVQIAAQLHARHPPPVRRRAHDVIQLLLDGEVGVTPSLCR